MTKESYLTAVTSAIEDCQKENLDIIVKLIVSVDRRNQLAEAEEVVDLALAFRSRGVVGIDLCGHVEAGLFENLKPAFERAKQHGFPITLHFNEIIANLKEAPSLLSIHPDRLGHATFLDDYCRKAIYERKIPIEICMSSNVLCKTVKTFEEHHIKELLHDKHPFVLCVSDDRLQSLSRGRGRCINDNINDFSPRLMIKVCFSRMRLMNTSWLLKHSS